MPFYTEVASKCVRLTHLSLVQLERRPSDAELAEQQPPTRDTGGTKTWFRLGQTLCWKESDDGPVAHQVPDGHLTDLASIPRFMWGVVPSYGRHTASAILHDYLCDVSKPEPPPYRRALRRAADDLFRRTLREHAGTGYVTAWLMWAAVRLFASVLIGVFTIAAAVLTAGTLWLASTDDSGTGLDGHVDVLITGYLAIVSVVGLLWLIHGSSREASSSSEAEEFNWPAFGSMCRAAIVGALAVVPLLALVLVTGITNLVLWVLNVIFVLPGWVSAKLNPAAPAIDGAQPTEPRRLPEFSLFPGP